MQRQSVNSTDLKSVGYEPQTNILEIEFKKGSIYQYSEVPDYIYTGLIGAASHGKYFNAHIKKHFSFRKIR
ncbi:MAG: KTSC domain-containing protein [Patescibacteria group bacterium]